MNISILFNQLKAPIGVGLLLGCGLVQAVAPGHSESRDLHPELTPVGAEAAGNAEGSIPPWSGGITDFTQPIDRRMENRPRDLFAGEQPLFVITADNYHQYRSKLSAGHIALFQRDSDYRMPVYRTHRTVGFPGEIYKATRANLGRAKLEGTDGLSGARVGFPFPRPDNGAQVIWNHKLKYRTDGINRFNNEAIVEADGRYTLVRRFEQAKFVYASLSDNARADKGVFAYYIGTILEPRKHAGSVLVVHDSINVLERPRSAWMYNDGQRRVMRMPMLQHDETVPGTDGLQTVDQIDMFNGALERYDWKLLGKRELYIPYNAFRLSDKGLRYEDILAPRHINQTHTRYELHRVWVVEATVKEGLSHMFTRRRFYVDEDAWQIALVDLYDRRGQLWRFQEGHVVPFYIVPAVTTLPEIIYDLDARRYLITAMNNEDHPYQTVPDLKATDFTKMRMKFFKPRDPD